MPSGRVVVASEIVSSPRVLQASGIFDVPPSKRSELMWDVSIPVEDRDWNVGLIVGPSGSGKSTVTRSLFGDYLAPEFFWPAEASILDAFPKDMGIKDVVELLSSVGFSSPPSWVRPYRVLSTGEQFRVTMARLLAEAPAIVVVDEFTSVVDRTVAQVGSAAIARTIRRRGQRFVAVTCHEDVEAWLDPDWVYRPDVNTFSWRSLQGRPPIELQINRVHYSAWKLFRRHHYLSAQLSMSAHCFIAFWHGVPVAFSAWLPMLHAQITHTKRDHRTVCLPDYQGVGIGNALNETCASMWRGLGYRATSTTSHPAMVRHRARSPLWKMTRGPSRTVAIGGMNTRDPRMARTRADTRLSAGFEYVGPAMAKDQAEHLMTSWALVGTGSA